MKHRTGLAHAALLLGLPGATLVPARPSVLEPTDLQLKINPLDTLLESEPAGVELP
jgi:hypothetical protein